MPYLRPFYDPEFTLVGDAIDFVTQMLEVRQPNRTRGQALTGRIGTGFHAHTPCCPSVMIEAIF